MSDETTDETEKELFEKLKKSEKIWKKKWEEFAPKTLVLLYLKEVKKQEIGVNSDNEEFKTGVSHDKLKNDIQKICSKLHSEHDILIPIGFKPFGKGIYSERLDDDLNFLHSVGLIDIIYHPDLFGYEITQEGKEEITLPKGGCREGHCGKRSVYISSFVMPAAIEAVLKGGILFDGWQVLWKTEIAIEEVLKEGTSEKEWFQQIDWSYDY